MGSLSDHKSAALPGNSSISDRELAFWAAGGTLTKGAAKTVVFDEFTRTNRNLQGDTADSGQVYESAGAGAIVGGQMAAIGAGQASYNRLNLGAPMRAMSCLFVFTAGTGNGGLAIINTATSDVGIVPLGNSWLHLSISPVGWGLSWTTPGPLTLNVIDSLDFKNPLLRDGTVYGASMEIIGTRALITIWNNTTGQVLYVRKTPTDVHFTSYLGSYCIWEPINANGAVGGSAIVNISATTKTSTLDPAPLTRGDVAELASLIAGDPFGLGYATNLPPFVPLTIFGVNAINYGLVSKLVSDSAIGCTKISLQVSVASGNICVGVYRLTQSGQITRLATSGTVACPASGLGVINLLSPVTAFRATDYLALSVDNITATFYGSAGSQIIGQTGGHGLMTGAVPLPAGPIGALWYAGGPTHQMLLLP